MSPWNRLDSVNQNCRLAEFSLFFFYSWQGFNVVAVHSHMIYSQMD